MFFRKSMDSISPEIRRIAKSVKPPERKRVLRSMGTTFKSITEGTFNSAGSQYRPAPWPAKKDGSPSNLQKSTTMSKAFALEVTDDIARVSNPTKYSRRHQLGDKGAVAGKKVGTVKTKYVNKSFAGSWNEVREGGKGMPPRPFFPVLNGKLTPAAEQKIAAAGQRTLARVIGAKGS